MRVRVAASYIERLLMEQDLPGLYQVVGILGEERDLPEAGWLFMRLLEWEGATRSGIWQYHEGLPEETFQRVNRALEQAGLSDIAEQYRGGQRTWNTPEQAVSVDRWIDKQQPRIREAALSLLTSCRPFLFAGASTNE